MSHSIKLSESQFITLLKLAYAGDWLINSHRVDPVREYTDLLEYLFSMTKEFNVKGISDQDTPQFPTREFE